MSEFDNQNFIIKEDGTIVRKPQKESIKSGDNSKINNPKIDELKKRLTTPQNNIQNERQTEERISSQSSESDNNHIPSSKSNDSSKKTGCLVSIGLYLFLSAICHFVLGVPEPFDVLAPLVIAFIYFLFGS